MTELPDLPVPTVDLVFPDPRGNPVQLERMARPAPPELTVLLELRVPTAGEVQMERLVEAALPAQPVPPPRWQSGSDRASRTRLDRLSSRAE